MSKKMASVTRLQKLKIADLKKELKELGLAVSGNKTELVARLQSHYQAGTGNTTLNDSGGGEDADILEDDDILDDDDDVPEGDISLDGDDTLNLVADEKENKNETVKKAVVSPPEETQEKPSPKEKVEAEKIKNPITAPLSNEQKIAERAKKFGLVSEDAKLQTRAARFGGTENGTKSNVISSAKPEDADKIKARAERFGISTPSSLSKLDDKNSLLKRQQRFGLTPDSTSANTMFDSKKSKIEDDDKIAKRKERFGAVSNTVVSMETDEKKRKRAERFGTPVVSTKSGSLDDAKQKRAARFGIV